MESIKQKSLDMNNFIEALKGNDISFIERFINSGFDLNEYDSKYDGVTPLIFASIAGDVSVIKMLIQAGANVNLGDKFNNTPLHWAAAYGKTDKVEILIKEKANIKALNVYKETPLLYAMIKSQLITPIQLIQAGADITAVNKKGESVHSLNKVHDMDLDHLLDHQVIRDIEVLLRKFYLHLSQTKNSKVLINNELLDQSFTDFLEELINICEKNNINLIKSKNIESILDTVNKALHGIVGVINQENTQKEYGFEQASLMVISINELTKPLYPLFKDINS